MRINLDCGYIEYRMPNIGEGLRLLTQLGVNMKNSQDSNYLEDNSLSMLAELILVMGSYITEVKIKLGEREVNSYDDLLTCHSLRESVFKIAGDIFKSIGGGDEAEKK